MSFDWNQAANDLRAIRAENEVSLQIRRGDSELVAQDMRIEMMGPNKAYVAESEAARIAKQAVYILGEPDMDIEPMDRMTYNGLLIQVVFVQPNRLAGTIAEGIVED